MKRNTPIKNIMSNRVVVAKPDTKFTDVQTLFLEFNVNHLPVVDDEDNLIGIISSNDVMHYYARNIAMLKDHTSDAVNEAFKVKDAMTSHPVTIRSDDTIEKATSIFYSGKFQALPVVDDGIIKGIISTKDIVRFLYDYYNS